MLKSHRSLCVAFSRTGAGLCIYHMLVWSNLNFLHIFQWITLPTQSCLALYSRSANYYYYYYYHYHYYYYSLRVFLINVFHWILWNKRAPQLSRILPNILATLNNAVIWMVSFFSRFPILPGSFASPWELFLVQHLLLVWRSPSCSTALSALWQVKIFVLIFGFLNFDSVVRWISKIQQLTGPFFIVDYHLVLSSLRYWMICLYHRFQRILEV